jgi:diguanylate cyclase (GGDEF)-like protein/PAS domain S-box-containing protein
MMIYDIVTIVQILSGISILFFSILQGLKIKKDLPKDLQGKWRTVISLIGFFILCYISFVFILLLNRSFPLGMVTGSVFLAGACFVYLVIRITRTTMQHKNRQDRDLQLDAQQMAESIASLREINEDLEQEISRRILSEEAFRKSEEKYSSLVESSEDSIYLIDRDCRYLFINKKHLLRIGLSEEEYRGKSYGDFHTPEVTKRFTEIVDKVIRTGKSVQLEHKSTRDDNYFLLTLSPVMESEGKISAVTVVSKKITELKKMQEELHTLSLTDALTGLYNRRGFMTLAEQHLKIASRMKSQVFMLYADLDNLKDINDTFGHQEGDTALKETAQILRETFREADIVSRIGGDEFVVMPIGSSERDTGAVNLRLQNNLDLHNEKKNGKYTLSLSIGITHYDPARPVTPEELLFQSDKLMYEQKIKKKKVLR